MRRFLAVLALVAIAASGCSHGQKRPASTPMKFGPGNQPVTVHNPRPPFPHEAIVANVNEGLVILEVTVGETGRVIHVDVLESDPLFDESAVSTVRQWIYEPILVDGKPIVWRT